MITVTVARLGTPEADDADFVCDGINDEIEINAAIIFAASLGLAADENATVELGSGTYSIAGPIVSEFSNTFISGSGVDATTLQAADNYFSAINVFGTQYSGLVNFCAVDNFGLSGVTVDAATNNILTNGIVMIPDGSGGSDGSGAICTNGSISHNAVFLVQGHCYSIWSLRGEHIEIAQNLIDGGEALSGHASQEGIEVYGGSDVRIIDNTVRNVGGAAVNIGGISIGSTDFSVADVFVSGNVIENSRIGVHIGSYSTDDTAIDITNVAVVENNLSGISQYGVWLYVGRDEPGVTAQISDITVGNNSISTTVPMDVSLPVPAGFYFLNTTASGETAFSNVQISDNAFLQQEVMAPAYPFITDFPNPAHLLFVGAENFTVARNEINSLGREGGRSEGLRIHNSRDFSIVENRVDGADSYAAYVYNSDNFEISGNTFNNWNREARSIAGLVLDTVENVRLADNIFAPANFSGGSVVAWRGVALDAENNELVASTDARLVDGIIDVLRLSDEAVTAIGGVRGETLFGNALSNVIDGASGADAMYGGLGDDSYYVDNALDVVIELTDEGTDRIYANVSYSLAEDSEVEILTAGIAAVDLSGNSGDNTIEGNARANNLVGGRGSDVLYGHAGHDTLNGGTGVDTMYGGVGDDSYFIDDALDLIVELQNEGVDRAYASTSYVLTDGSEVENLSIIDPFGTAGIDLTGNSGANIIEGNAGANSLAGGSGADMLFGLAGSDLIDGGFGVDAMYGGSGDDTYFVDEAFDLVIEETGEGTDHILANASYVLSEGSEIEMISASDVFAAIAINLTGNSGANIIAGNARANSLAGGGGADVLYGHGGNDLIDGGTGIDTMYGGAGSDNYYVDEAFDLVIEAAGEGVDRVYASVSYVLAEGSEVEILTTADVFASAAVNLTGNDGANTIGGNARGNSLAGGGGDDLLYGHAGNDLIDGGTGIDVMHGGVGSDNFYVDDALDQVIEVRGEGSDRIYASTSYALADGMEVETLSTTDVFGTASINLIGNSGANTVGGNAGSNVISGGGGSDILWGNGGADTFVFDTMIGGGNIDYLKDFSAADDMIELDADIFSSLGDGVLDAVNFARPDEAAQEQGYILYDSAAGAISYDPDGVGSAASTIFAYVPIGTELTHEQFVVI